MNTLLKVCEVSLAYRPKVKTSERPVVRTSDSVYNLLMNYAFDKATIQHREFLKLVLLNRSCRVLGISHIAEGGLNEVSADIRHIMQVAILGNSSVIILAHNHPSGSLRPSMPDDRLTTRVREVAELLEITLSDHIIVTEEGYYSYADEGRI